jgi:hypothetical protein
MNGWENEYMVLDERLNKQHKRFKTRSKLKWAFPFYEKYDQIKETPLKYTIFPSIKYKTSELHHMPAL